MTNKKLYVGILLGILAGWFAYPFSQKYFANVAQTATPPKVVATEKVAPFEGLPGEVKAGQEQVYGNARFGYSVKYPSDMLFPQGEADNGDGQRLLSKDAKAELAVYGAINIDYTSLEADFNQESRGGMANDTKRVVAYKRMKDNWFVVSGFREGNIFYLKRFLVGDYFITFDFSYPESEKAKWDPVLTKMVANFNPGN